MPYDVRPDYINPFECAIEENWALYKVASRQRNGEGESLEIRIMETYESRQPTPKGLSGSRYSEDAVEGVYGGEGC